MKTHIARFSGRIYCGLPAFPTQDGTYINRDSGNTVRVVTVDNVPKHKENVCQQCLDLSRGARIRHS